jgi:hypothetical protein
MASYKGRKNVDREEAFWSKIDRSAPYECWPYKEYKNKDGYGQFHTENGPIGAHIYSWKITRKCEVPEEKLIMHLCDNPACCNPNHLICGDALKNAQDKIEKGHTPQAHRTALPDLHDGEIWLVRRLLSSKIISQARISKMFKVHQSTISHINTSDRWLCKEGTYV